MKWCRWYRGSVEDAKFRVTARHANVTVCHAIGVWASLLEDATKREHRGVYTRGLEYISVVLDIDGQTLDAIFDSFEDQGMITRDGDNIIIKQWDALQYDNDTKDPTAAERQRRAREKKRHGSVTEASQQNHDQIQIQIQKQKREEAPQADAPKLRGERIEVFMGRQFPESPTECPEEWGEAAVKAAHAYAPGTSADLVKLINWHFEKFYAFFAISTKANACKKDWRMAWLNWWKTEFEKIAKQEERDGILRQKVKAYR